MQPLPGPRIRRRDPHRLLAIVGSVDIVRRRLSLADPINGVPVMQKLEAQQIDANLAELAEWSLNGDALQRTFRFDDFIGAMAFVSRIADLAEEMQHHPDIMIRYNKVTLTLTTHDAAGLTENDFSFARATDGYVAAV